MTQGIKKLLTHIIDRAVVYCLFNVGAIQVLTA